MNKDENIKYNENECEIRVGNGFDLFPVIVLHNL